MSLARNSAKALAALAGAAMFASMIAAAPATAMPLPVASGVSEVGAPVEKVWWDRWGRWHREHRYWGGPVYFGGPVFYAPPRLHRTCWYGPWGGMQCRWVR
jgi:hypothetical protein